MTIGRLITPILSYLASADAIAVMKSSWDCLVSFSLRSHVLRNGATTLFGDLPVQVKGSGDLVIVGTEVEATSRLEGGRAMLACSEAAG